MTTTWYRIAFTLLGIVLGAAGFWLYDRGLPEPKNTVPGQAVFLYYYNPSTDMDSEGNIACSPNGLDRVERVIPASAEPVKETIRLLLSGFVTDEEKKRGISTEYPLSGFTLADATLDSGGTLTLAFVDKENKTTGGSCRVGILWFQIEETAKQFPGVVRVRFAPDTLFQP